jgi:hypothetical protein
MTHNLLSPPPLGASTPQDGNNMHTLQMAIVDKESKLHLSVVWQAHVICEHHDGRSTEIAKSMAYNN